MTDEPSPHVPDPDSGPAPDESDAPDLAGSEPIVAVDPLDERLSAELDGESTNGSNTDNDPRADARRRELTEARDLSAIAPPPIDDVTRRRLLRVAIAERPQGNPRDLHRLNQVGAVAAVLALVVLGGLGLKALVSTSDSQSARKANTNFGAASGTTSADAVPKAALDLHDVSDPQVLREQVASLLSLKSSSTTTFAAPESSAGGKHGATNDSSATKCLSTITVPAGSTAPTALGDATYKRTPAVVVVAFKGRQTLIYVVAKQDCRLLTSQFFGR